MPSFRHNAVQQWWWAWPSFWGKPFPSWSHDHILKASRRKPFETTLAHMCTSSWLLCYLQSSVAATTSTTSLTLLFPFLNQLNPRREKEIQIRSLASETIQFWNSWGLYNVAWVIGIRHITFAPGYHPVHAPWALNKTEVQNGVRRWICAVSDGWDSRNGCYHVQRMMLLPDGDLWVPMDTMAWMMINGHHGIGIHLTDSLRVCSGVDITADITRPIHFLSLILL